MSQTIDHSSFLDQIDKNVTNMLKLTACGVSGALYSMIFCMSGCSCLYSCFYRSKLRGQYFLEEQPCTDCCVHLCCETCSLCQEYRELENRGLDLSIGTYIFPFIWMINFTFNVCLNWEKMNLICRMACKFGEAKTKGCCWYRSTNSTRHEALDFILTLTVLML